MNIGVKVRWSLASDVPDVVQKFADAARSGTTFPVAINFIFEDDTVGTSSREDLLCRVRTFAISDDQYYREAIIGLETAP